MPTYSYLCTACDHAFDAYQAFTDASLTVCNTCGGKLRKLFGTVGVTFNGSGFYRTDSRGDKNVASVAKPEKATPATTRASESTSGSAAPA